MQLAQERLDSEKGISQTQIFFMASVTTHSGFAGADPRVVFFPFFFLFLCLPLPPLSLEYYCSECAQEPPGGQADMQILIQQAQGGTQNSAFQMCFLVIKLLQVWDHILSSKGLEVVDSITPSN